jgi:hypothetical protein
MLGSVKFWLMASGAFALFYVYTLSSTWLEIWPSKKTDGGKIAEAVENNKMVKKWSLMLMAVAVAVYAGVYYKATHY